MSRILRTCKEFAQELDRELFQSGITVPVNHYQNKKLEGNDRYTKEIVGVNFCISNPLKGRKEMLEYLFKNDADRIEKYCIQEFKDRISPVPLNPGNSYKIRKDMWQKFMIEDETKFDYSYSERLYDKWQYVIAALKEDKHSRQALMEVFKPDDLEKHGGDTRIPCSICYQYLIRNDQLHCIYTMRSNDYFGHHPIDIWLAAESILYLQEELIKTYPELKTGKLYYQAGSLHAYQWDLKERLLF
jgi:thymidylate synthase